MVLQLLSVKVTGGNDDGRSLTCIYIIVYLTVQEPCNGTDTIRLTQYNDDSLGRLEVCSSGIWGSVCGNDVTDNIAIDNIAIVACRELNHAASGKYTIISYIATVYIIISGFVLTEEAIGFFFLLIPITRTNMECSGFENTISECYFEGFDGDLTCAHGDDVFVICDRKLFQPIL